jgi:uncharacterized protein YebE (UPF0316 family)
MRKDKNSGFIILILDIITIIFFLVWALITLFKDNEKLAALISFLKQIFSL